jgi:DNA ligase (NAD+)
MDIAGFGAKQAELFVQKGLIREIADIYDLHKHRQDILALEGFAEKKVENLLRAIEASKAQPATRVLTALGIRFVGSTIAELLLEHTRSIDALATTPPEELERIEGIGPRIAESVRSWFSEPPNQRTLARLRAAGLNMALPDQAPSSTQPLLQGKTFVLTGALPSWSRQEATEIIKAHGGKVSSAVSSRTDYVLAGENPGSKLTKAQKLGVPILTEAEFRKMLGLE